MHWFFGGSSHPRKQRLKKAPKLKVVSDKSDFPHVCCNLFSYGNSF